MNVFGRVVQKVVCAAWPPFLMLRAAASIRTKRNLCCAFPVRASLRPAFPGPSRSPRPRGLEPAHQQPACPRSRLKVTRPPGGILTHGKPAGPHFQRKLFVLIWGLDMKGTVVGPGSERPEAKALGDGLLAPVLRQKGPGRPLSQAQVWRESPGPFASPPPAPPADF